MDGLPQIDLFGDSRPIAEKPVPMVPQHPGHGLPDGPERARIVVDLDANLLVEAGAGAGKTTEMVNRMVALVGAGSPVERIAAVTFTRKAAAELRERFQTSLEKELRRIRDTGNEQATRIVDRALREIDRAFIGTIHAFCARLLRERPLEAGVDPSFRETFAIEQDRLRHEFFAHHIERLAAAGDAGLAQLAHVGLRPDQLRRLFEELTEHGDVEFPVESVERPDPAEARQALDELLDDALQLMPDEEPDRGWDNLQSTIRRLRFYRDVVGWDDDIRFLHVLAENLAAMPRATYRRWASGSGVIDVVKQLATRFRNYADVGGEGGRVLRQWWAHRYPIAIAFARQAAHAFEGERLRTGALSFQDLLICTARLLRDNPNARLDLGERYRHILVDEFQDTDPMQAEILFLLASPPDNDGDGSLDWRRVVPRPGSLFVVGDPKQSIYRFRRADITIYNQVKRRFEDVGGVVSLTANFRSGPPIEVLVDRVFAERFPPIATEHQAAFAPLQVQKASEAGQAVYSYRVEKPGDRPREAELADRDAARVASWIESRIAERSRRPGDFLVLTRKKKHLATYAREIEARNLPVQVTGGGVGIENEMSELRLLLQALADPGDPTYTVATLIGLFFGLDYEQLAVHVLDCGGRLQFTEPPPEPETAVEQALAKLHAWWATSRSEPADVFVSRLVYELGLLQYAAAGDLGESRAGALLFVLEAVRGEALQGDASLRGAIGAIDAALGTEDAEAPLEPGRADAVRVMNLHQAKGLEAPVVILAAPFGEWRPAPTLHVTRKESGVAEARIVVAERRWRFNDTVLARPLDWPEHEDAERAFDEAERDRLLYVAATRAQDELLISRYPDASESPWSPFEPHLAGFPILELPVRPKPQREHLGVSAEHVLALVAETNAHRQTLATPSWEAAAVRTRVKTDTAIVEAPAGPDRAGNASTAGIAPQSALHQAPEDADDEAGMAWGRLVHEALEAAGRGAAGDALAAQCRTILLAVEDPQIDEHDEPVDLDRLIDVVTSVTGSDIWRRASAADTMLVEVPFSIALPLSDYRAVASDERTAAVQVIDGVIDLAFREQDGWVIVDYKSDRDGKGVTSEVLVTYKRQVELYAQCWTRLTHEAVRERAILFTTDSEVESW